MDGVADERCTRCDIGHGQLNDGPRAGGSFGVVVECALHLGGDGLRRASCRKRSAIVSNEAPVVQARDSAHDHLLFVKSRTEWSDEIGPAKWFKPLTIPERKF